MKSGYIVVHAPVDLTWDDTGTTVSGLYARLSAAIACGKLIVLEGCMIDGVTVSPLIVYGLMDSGNCVCNLGNLQIIVNSGDGVHVVTLAPETPAGT